MQAGCARVLLQSLSHGWLFIVYILFAFPKLKKKTNLKTTKNTCKRIIKNKNKKQKSRKIFKSMLEVSLLRPSALK